MSSQKKNEPRADEIDAVMAEMEAMTPRIPEIKISQTFFQERIVEVQKEVADEIQKEVADEIDAKNYAISLFQSKPKKPGELHPSRPTAEKYYDTSHKNIGTALIFNQVTFKNNAERKGSKKDAEDLRDVLLDLGFDAAVYTDFTVDQIRNCLYSGKTIKFPILLCRSTFSSSSFFVQYQNATTAKMTALSWR